MDKCRVFKNGRIYCNFQALESDIKFQQALIVECGKIVFVGDETSLQVESAIEGGAEVVDLNHRIVLPSFIDSHSHFLLFGLSLRKLDLSGCHSLEEIERSIAEYAKGHPEAPRILCRGWHQPSTGGRALASMIDHLDPRPIFIEALDLHSTWCNTAALDEMQVDTLEDPNGGTIYRDVNGRPTGLLDESAQIQIVWPHLMKVCDPSEKLAALNDATKAYIEAGYAGLIDMAMDMDGWNALVEFRAQHRMPLHIAAHWLIPYSVNFAEMKAYLDEAIATREKHHPSTSPSFCVTGIKLIADGVVDGCTAAISHPYGSGSHPVEPIWPPGPMAEIVKLATASGLQVAIHAIGDVAIKHAIDAIASAKSHSGRHRIEHLELTTVEDAKRLGQLGITASIQPVHSDPAMVKAYPKIISPELWKRAFPYREFLENHACLAIGTDAPTARHLPLPNLYNATTRKSATEPDLDKVTHAQFAISLSQAVNAATSGAAYSRFADTWTGKLSADYRADFVVLDMEWSADQLLQARVKENWLAGELEFSLRQ